MSIIRWLVVVLCMALMVACSSDASVSSTDPIPTQPPNPNHGRIIGVVRDASGKPIAKAALALVAGPGPLIEIAALTNERGEYEWTDLQAGEWTLAANADGFKGKQLTVRVVGGQTAQLDFTLDT